MRLQRILDLHLGRIPTARERSALPGRVTQCYRELRNVEKDPGSRLPRWQCYCDGPLTRLECVGSATCSARIHEFVLQGHRFVLRSNSFQVTRDRMAGATLSRPIEVGCACPRVAN